jgi:hypothetical protein
MATLTIKIDLDHVEFKRPGELTDMLGTVARCTEKLLRDPETLVIKASRNPFIWLRLSESATVVGKATVEV